MATACVIFTKNRYDFGLDQIIPYFKSQYQKSTLEFVLYVNSGTVSDVVSSLHQFIQDYPKGKRLIISDTTTAIATISAYLEEIGLVNEIPSFSISASSPAVIQPLPNSLTLGYFITKFIISSFLIYKEYNMKNVFILSDPTSSNIIFMNETIDYITNQCKYLQIPYSHYDLHKGGKYTIPLHSVIYVLCDSINIPVFFTPDVIDKIPVNCYILLSTLNFDIIDNIFGRIPCFVPLPTPINFTSTSQTIYNVVSSKNKYYGIYAFWDILIIIQYILDHPSLPLTIDTFISVDAFNESPAAWINSSSFDKSINGINDGTYDLIFLSDVFFNQPPCYSLKSYLPYYQGGILNLSNSYSVFRTIGIISFYHSPFYYVQQDLQNVYDKNNRQLFCCFEKSIINYPIGTTIFTNVAEVVQFKFLYSNRSDGYFDKLEVILDYDGCEPIVNSTMSKKPIKRRITGL